MCFILAYKISACKIMYTSKNQKNVSFLPWIVVSLEYLSHLKPQKRIVVATTIRGNTVFASLPIMSPDLRPMATASKTWGQGTIQVTGDFHPLNV